MKKVLIVPTLGLNLEGITTVIYNYTKAMNRDGLSFHFLTYGDLLPSLRERFAPLGQIEFVADRKQSTKAYILDYIRLLRTGSFDVVHIHGNSGTMAIEAVLAKLCGVRKVIVHCHNTKTDHPIINYLLKVPMMCLADTCIACSKAAGEWLYGRHPYIVLNNAIDLPRFRFLESIRTKYRDEFNVKEEFLLGHIGNFVPQKNHFFLIDIFYEFHKLDANSKLLLLSDGPRFEQVKIKVAELGLHDAVIFAGRRNDVAEIYSAMDLFVLPSCWEGLPLVMVEAQANGLPLLVSDVITTDAKCTDKTFFKSLDHGAEAWAKQILQIKSQNYNREADTYSAIAENGFDIQLEADKLKKLYLCQQN